MFAGWWKRSHFKRKIENPARERTVLGEAGGVEGNTKSWWIHKWLVRRLGPVPFMSGRPTGIQRLKEICLVKAWHIRVKQKAAFILWGEQIMGKPVSLDDLVACWWGAKHSRSFLLANLGLLRCIWYNPVTRSVSFLPSTGEYSRS